jgi:L-lactate permease
VAILVTRATETVALGVAPTHDRVLLVGLRWPAKWAMPIVFLQTAVIALAAWDMSFRRVAASTVQGLRLTIAILWIVFGAILLLNTLKHSGALAVVGWIRPTHHPRRPAGRPPTPACR